MAKKAHNTNIFSGDSFGWEPLVLEQRASLNCVTSLLLGQSCVGRNLLLRFLFSPKLLLSLLTLFSLIVPETVVESPPAKSVHHEENLLTPGSPVSQHSSNRSDDEYAGEHADDAGKKVKKQKSFKKAFMKKFQAKK